MEGERLAMEGQEGEEEEGKQLEEDEVFPPGKEETAQPQLKGPIQGTDTPNQHSEIVSPAPPVPPIQHFPPAPHLP